MCDRDSGELIGKHDVKRYVLDGSSRWGAGRLAPYFFYAHELAMTNYYCLDGRGKQCGSRFRLAPYFFAHFALTIFALRTVRPQAHHGAF